LLCFILCRVVASRDDEASLQMGPLPEEETHDDAVAPEAYPRDSARYHQQVCLMGACGVDVHSFGGRVAQRRSGRGGPL
jgi:hypothetical protein